MRDAADELRQGIAAEALLAAAARLCARGWCSGSGGNFSVTLGRDPLLLLVTRSGADKERLSTEDLVLVGAGGVALDSTGPRPSAEAPLHALLAAEVPAGAVLHTHSVWGTILGRHFLERGGFRIRGYEMQKGLEGLKSHEDELFVPVLANSQDMGELSARLRQAVATQRGLTGLLIAGHGLYAWGRTPDQARRHVEVLEFLFEVTGRRVTLAPFEG